MLDNSKFGVKSLMSVLQPGQMTTLITDDGAPPEIVEQMCGCGVHVVTVRSA